MSLSEFELIQQFFSDIDHAHSEAIPLGVGDDCALLQLPTNEQLAISIDTLVAGVHFPETAAPYDLACRSVAVTVSDLAAMGATPFAFTLALTLPDVDVVWLEDFSRGLRDSARLYGLSLVGGDTTRGPLCLSLQMHGAVPAGQALTRAGAQEGDLVVVSGSLGDGRAALECFKTDCAISQAHKEYLLDRFYRPRARVELGQSLRGLASAAIDVSDGLVADVSHIAQASKVTVELDHEAVPLSEALRANWPLDVARGFALSGGDDYELCFTVSPDHFRQLQSSVPLAVVGRILPQGEGDCVDPDGNLIELSGYRHFV